MKKILLPILFLAVIAGLFLFVQPTNATVTGDGMVWESRVDGSNNNSGGVVWVSLVNATYCWTISGNGTNEYYVQLNDGSGCDGGNPGLTEAKSVYTDNNYNIVLPGGGTNNGTVGSLTAGQWDWGDNDSLGYSTVYVRLADDTDPDAKRAYDWIGMVRNGGQDYSQQATAHLAIVANLTIGADNTTITSTDVGQQFDSLDVGNTLNIFGGLNFTVGRYEIRSVALGIATLDRACGTATQTGGTGNLGGAMAVPLDNSITAGNFYDAPADTWAAPGRRIYYRAGTYTFTESVSITGTYDDGTAALPNWIIGYNTIRGDDPDCRTPVATICPYFSNGANTFNVRTYNIVKNISAIGTGSAPLGIISTAGATNNLFINCKAINNLNTAASTALGSIGTGSNHNFINSEAISWRGWGIKGGSGGSNRFINDYSHDTDAGSATGQAAFNFGDVGNTILKSIAVGSQTGFYFTSTGSGLVMNSITDDNQQGEYIQGSGALYNFNNLITNNKNYGIQNTAGLITKSVYSDYNLWFGNFLNTIYYDIGENEIIGSDPLYTNPTGTLVDNLDATTGWTAGPLQGANVTFQTATGKLLTGNSLQVNIGANAVAGLLAYKTISATDMSTWPGLHGWVQVIDTSYVAGDLQIYLDDTADCSSPIIQYSLPAFTTTIWYKFWLHNDPTGMGAATAIACIGLYSPNDEGAGTLLFDEIRGGDRDFTVQSGSPVLDAAMPNACNVLTADSCKENIGPDQDDNAIGAARRFFLIN